MASACGKGQSESWQFYRSPQSHTTTRANISHEKAEQIRARKPARPLKVQGGRESSTRADESKDFCQPSPVGEGGARSVTDEVSFVKKDLKILCAYRTFA